MTFDSEDHAPILLIMVDHVHVHINDLEGQGHMDVMAGTWNSHTAVSGSVLVRVVGNRVRHSANHNLLPDMPLCSLDIQL